MKVNNGRKVQGWRVVLAVSCLAGLLLLPGIAYAQDEIECGDAPSSYNHSPDAASPTGSLLMTAYPKGGPLGVQANFPVVVFPPAESPDGYGMCHLPGPSFMGPAPLPSKSLEIDADQGWDQDGLSNIDPTTDSSDRDGHDDGVTFPAQLPDCSPVNIFVEGYIYYVVGAGPEYYIDAWFDWNRDGDWSDGVVCGCGDNEWAIQDHLLTPNPTTHYFSASIPVVPCNPVSDTDPLWVRMTLADRKLTEDLTFDHSGGGVWYWEGCLLDGETEDYYLQPAGREEFVPEPGTILLLGSGLMGLAGYATLRWRNKE